MWVDTRSRTRETELTVLFPAAPYLDVGCDNKVIVRDLIKKKKFLMTLGIGQASNTDFFSLLLAPHKMH